VARLCHQDQPRALRALAASICRTAGYWEPDEPRGSRPVLRERGGETPPRHSILESDFNHWFALQGRTLTRFLTLACDQASRRPSTTLATGACRRRRQGGTATEIVKARHANLPIFVSVLATQSERPPTSDSVLLIPPCRLHRQELDRRSFSQDRKSKQSVLPIRGNLVAKGRNRQSVSPPAIHGASGPTPQHLVYVSQSK
jgi:hypothetical protein